ncbi:MAG: 3-hydroxyacyl-CoA dehydrogenase NAD-binding domain-containing protein [Nitrososphaeria archaeon]
MKNANILIIGSGYVGLTVAVSFASFGFKVVLYDIDSKKLDNLRNGILPIEEPSLSNFFLEKTKIDLTFSYNVRRSIASSDLISITVGTEVKNGELGLSNFYLAINTLLQTVDSKKLSLSNLQFQLAQQTKLS